MSSFMPEPLQQHSNDSFLQSSCIQVGLPDMKLGLEQALLTRLGTVYMQTLGAVATMVTQYSTGLHAAAAVKPGMSAWRLLLLCGNVCGLCSSLNHHTLLSQLQPHMTRCSAAIRNAYMMPTAHSHCHAALGAYSRASAASKSGRLPIDSRPLLVHTTRDGALSFSLGISSCMRAIGPW